MDDRSQKHIHAFSKQGLRTLIIARREIPQAEFGPWEQQMRAALATVDESRNQKVADASAALEVRLQFVGITAVEDRLQDGVPEAIATLKAGGIRLWVLTGDKVETAVDIARSCHLFGDKTLLAYSTGAKDATEAQALLKAADSKLLTGHSEDTGLVFDGQTLGFCLGDPELRAAIYRLGLQSRCCVCCRLSPKQKRLLVELVREASPSTITLAIGDGANDVPMIEGAHLGIGIRGKEGAQAVQVSDVAISQFRFLVPLLLLHGRRAYRRVAFFLCYYLYKNVALVACDLVWAHQSGIKGDICFAEWLTQSYTVILTSFHVIFVLAFDQDVPDEVGVSTPELYLVGPQRAHFNYRIFAKWMAYAVWHGVVLWLLPSLWFGGTTYTKDTPSVFWEGSCTTFVAVVIIVNLKLWLLSTNPGKATTIGAILVSLLLTGITLFVLGSKAFDFMQPNLLGVPSDMFQRGAAIFCMLVAPLLCFSIDAADRAVQFFFFPTVLDTVQIKVRQGETSSPKQ